MKPQRVWCVVGQDGHAYLHTVSKTEAGAIDKWCDYQERSLWDAAQERGYRCVCCTLTEEE